MKIVWSGFAKNELKKIFEYYRKKASERIAKKIINGISDETLKLKTFPYSGEEENLLANKVLNYRRIIHNNYKIIYTVNQEKNEIRITDVFDCRQNPDKLDRNK